MIQNKFSIIVPSLNQGTYIEQTLNSIFSQSYKTIEVIVCDGGSTDDTPSILRNYEPLIKKIISEPDKGQSDAINKGIKHATGDIITWLNTDDYYKPNVLMSVNEHFQSKKIIAVLGRSRIFWEGTNKEKISKGTRIFSTLERTIGDSLLDQPPSFFKREAFDRINPLNTELRYLMDREMWIKYLIVFGQNHIKKSDEVWVNFRIHNASKSGSEIEHFNKERNSIYRSLAIHTNTNWAIKLFDQLNWSSTSNTVWPPNEQAIDFNKVFSEFFMVWALEKYEAGDLESTRFILSHIKADWLELGSANQLQKIQKRFQLLPIFIHRFLKKR